MALACDCEPAVTVAVGEMRVVVEACDMVLVRCGRWKRRVGSGRVSA